MNKTLNTSEQTHILRQIIQACHLICLRFATIYILRNQIKRTIISRRHEKILGLCTITAEVVFVLTGDCSCHVRRPLSTADAWVTALVTL
jgi:cell division protein FtsX